MQIRSIALVIAVLGSLLGISAATSAQAQSTAHIVKFAGNPPAAQNSTKYHGFPSRILYQQSLKNSVTGPFYLEETYGCCSVVPGSSNNGANVREGNNPGWKVWFDYPGGTYYGNAIYYLEIFNGNQIETGSGGCNGNVQLTSNYGSTGTVWADNFQGGNLHFVNRYCDNNNGDGMWLAGQNSDGSAYTVCGDGTDCSGTERSFTLNS